MTNHAIPFGKYKDQPVEVLAGDRPYLEWLLAQSWFKNRYSELFTIVINNFQEPADTPEHNAMQIQFLNDRYVFDLLAPLVGISSGQVLCKQFELDGWDVFVDLASSEHIDIDKQLVTLIDEWGRSGMLDRERLDPEISRLEHALKKHPRRKFYVEIKPTVSDDFPSVLRQMKATKKGTGLMVLLVGTYTGIGANQEQFVSFMANEDIHVIFAE